MMNKPGLLPYKVLAKVDALYEIEDYNISLANVHEAWLETEGEGVKVCVLDTGTPNHVDIEVTGSTSFIPNYYEDKQGHGTHVSGIIKATRGNGVGVVGIAPKCELYTAAVLGADGSGSIESIVNGIYWAVDTIKADIINMSLGLDAAVPNIPSLVRACNYAKSKNVAVICAAGNEYGRVGQPARYNSVIAVAAVNNAKEHAAFSNVGPEIDFAMGGVNVFSTYLNNGYAKLSGTSMASPALAGVSALILSAHKKRGILLTVDQLYDHLKRIAFDVGPEGFDETFGHGIPVYKSCTTGEEVSDLDPPSLNKMSFWRRLLVFLTYLKFW